MDSAQNLKVLSDEIQLKASSIQDLQQKVSENTPKGGVLAKVAIVKYAVKYIAFTYFIAFLLSIMLPRDISSTITPIVFFVMLLYPIINNKIIKPNLIKKLNDEIMKIKKIADHKTKEFNTLCANELIPQIHNLYILQATQVQQKTIANKLNISTIEKILDDEFKNKKLEVIPSAVEQAEIIYRSLITSPSEDNIERIEIEID